MARMNIRDVAFGLLTVALALAGLWISRDYTMGTASEMSTGYFPRLICLLLLGLGAIVALRGALTKADREQPHVWIRPLLGVTLAILVFMFAIERLGLIFSAAVLVIVAGIASTETRPVSLVVSAVVLAIGSALIFVVGIRLPLDLWPWS